jgi:hypothetical protein
MRYGIEDVIKIQCRDIEINKIEVVIAIAIGLIG